MPFAIYGRDVLIIHGEGEIKTEYKDYKNHPLLTINNVENFKKTLDSLARSPLVKEIVSLDNESTHKINSLDGKTQLELTNDCAHVQQDNFEIDYSTGEAKLIKLFSQNEMLNKDILKNQFESKIINLENSVYILKYHKGVLKIEIYDTNIEEETKEIEIKEKVELQVKLNKKIKVWE